MLIPGMRLGPYELVGSLGAGGMGEVYRARDTKLQRDVAIKVLPDVFAADLDRLARFEREAQTLAALNHPNIAQIYGIVELPAKAGSHVIAHTGADLAVGAEAPSHQLAGSAIVMELVHGEDLSERISHGALPLPDALTIARQVADALAAAHELGIIHRDLKPANIKLREDGAVKVLDFGLAKALGADASGASMDAMNSPTLTGRATQMGVILGTAAYMAPEQAKGKAVDRRADIWAFGVVVYEMLTGRRAFGGDDIAEVLASVLKTDPDWTALPADLPPAVRRLLRRCLERDPKRRLRELGEAMLQLEEGLAEPPATSSVLISAAAPRPERLWRRVLPIVVAVIMTAGVMTLITLLRSRPVPPAGLVRFTHTPDASAPLTTNATYSDIALTHDGRTILYVSGGSDAVSHLYIRPIDKIEATLIRGAEGLRAPFVSPDDAWVGFLDQNNNANQLKKVSIFGGPPIVVTTAKGQILGATWADDRTIIMGSTKGLFRVPDAGGEPAVLTTTDRSRGEVMHAWPAVIPGTPSVLFTSTTSTESQLAVLDKPGGRIIPLKVAGSSPRYLPSGHIAFVGSDGFLRVVPFDLAHFEVTGNPVPMDVQVAVKASGAADFDVARDGRLIYAAGTSNVNDRSFVWVDRTGHETPTAAPPRGYFYARVSPDGMRLSLDIREQSSSAVWIWDMRGALTRLTSRSGHDEYGLWNPDGDRVIDYSRVGEKEGLYQSRANATGDSEMVLEKQDAYPNAVSPDGKILVFRTGGGSNDLFSVQLIGDHVVKPLIATEHNELNAAFSPDGKWLAYQSDLSGRMEVYVRPFPDVGANQWPISTAGGTKPVWSPLGTELFYVSDAALMSVPITTSRGRGFSAGAPAALFPRTRYYFGGVGRNYDVAPDGRRFVMIKKSPTETTSSVPITVVLNWMEDVEARLAKK